MAKNDLVLQDAFLDRLEIDGTDEDGTIVVRAQSDYGVILGKDQIRTLRDYLDDVLGEARDVDGETEEGPGPEPGPAPLGVEERLIRSAKDLLRAAVPEGSGDLVVFLER